jgi:hypothetical protein
MLMFEWILLLLFVAVVLTNLAQRLAVPYPSLLAIAGAGLAFLPFAPQIRIEPELVLALFAAPALLASTARRQPRQRWRARNTRPPSRLLKISMSRRLRPNTTNCGSTRSLPNARHCTGCARGARSAMKPFTAFRRSSTGPSSMLRQPEAFNRLRVEALSVGNP